MNKKKYYVVWEGVDPGIYTTWTECELQIKGYKGAKFCSFNTHEEAAQAFQSSPLDYINNKKKDPSKIKPTPSFYPKEVEDNSLAVDAACSGNPGKMEYRGIHIASRQQIFHFGPLQGTNNIGEFLAIVHGLALLKKEGFDMPIYSDSAIAIGWIKKKKCGTKLPHTQKNDKLFSMIERAENWLKNNIYSTRIIKWKTKEWGEIPADFGRK
ncbi:MAG: ribonuclease H family protein [Bacteroidaceae bacterium]|nr:ribonuclease H family protein [Bacteroidaceae bacterium]